MFSFQIFFPAEQESTKIRFQLEERKVKEQHVFPPSFAHAELKLKMAERLTFDIESLLDKASGITREQRLSGLGGWDEKKCIRLLKEIGYENPELAFQQLSLSTFPERLGRAREEIQLLIQLGADFRNPEFSLACIKAANATASAVLSEFTRLILWQDNQAPSSLPLDRANPLAERLGESQSGSSPAAYFPYLDELVDAHSYLSYANMQNLYSAMGQIGGREEYVASPNKSLERAYERLLHSSTSGMSSGEYAQNLEKFYSAYSRYSEKRAGNFLRRQELAGLQGFDRLHLALEPYANASVPVIMAAVMATPAGLPMGTLYFAADAKKAFEEGRIAEGILISATLSAPFFSAVRAGAAAGTTAARIGTAGMQASHAAGTVFQLQMAGSLVSLSIDCAQYGMSAEDVAALGQTMGFLGMPLAVEKATAGKVEGPKKEIKAVSQSLKNAKERGEILGVVASPIEANSKAGSAKKTHLMQRITPPKIDEVPKTLFWIRGTSSMFSKPGSSAKIWGAGGMEFGRERDVPAYLVNPQEVSVEAWAKRFEATINAAVERSLRQCWIMGYPALMQKPSGLPVVVISTRTASKFMIGERYEPYRENLEFALVNGKPEKTFMEGGIGLEIVYYFQKTHRIQLTKSEMQWVFEEAGRLFEAAGAGIDQSLRAYQRLEKMVQSARKRGVNDVEASAEAQRLSKLIFERSNAAIPAIFGYELPKRLQETGVHAGTGYTYVVGELVKGILIPRIYEALELGEVKKE